MFVAQRIATRYERTTIPSGYRTSAKLGFEGFWMATPGPIIVELALDSAADVSHCLKLGCGKSVSSLLLRKGRVLINESLN